MVERSSETAEVSQPITSLNVVFCRLWWCFLGPALLCFLAIQTGIAHDGWIASFDLVFLIVLLTTVGARWISFRVGDRKNAFGDIITLGQLRRYSILFIVGGVVLWIVANLLGNNIRH